MEQCAFVVWHLADRGDKSGCLRSGFRLHPRRRRGLRILRFLALIEPMVGLSPDPEDVESPLDPASTRLAFSDQPADFEGAGWVSVRSGYAE